jgi:hypothetical protein
MFRHVTTRLCGLIIVIAGIWGGLIPFLGPTFHFTLGPDQTWHWTTARLWLSVLPAIAAVLGGLVLMGRGPRLSGRFGALLALAGGVWFAIGPDVSMLWNHGVSQQGVAHGQHAITRMLEYLTLHSGIGVLITALAAYSLPGVVTSAAGRRRVAADAAVAGTGREAVAAGEGEPVAAREEEPVAAREGEPVAAREEEPVAAGTAGAEPDAGETGAMPVVDRGPGPEPVADRGVSEPAGNGAVAEPPADGGAAEPAAAPQASRSHMRTRRRGGLVGLITRR